MARKGSFLLRAEHVMLGAAGAFLLSVAAASGPALAQAQPTPPDAGEQITVRAPDYVVRRVPISGRPYRLMNAEVISLSRPVSYADLDLSDASDAAELERRVAETARDVCRELNRLYPRTSFQVIVDTDCVRTATDNAMAVARQVIAASG